MTRITKKQIQNEIGFKEKIVYHYCSLEALYGIISSRSLWLTSLSSTNDKKELSYGKSFLNETLTEMIGNEKYTKIKPMLFKMLDAYNIKLEENKYLAKYFYGASFVEKKDSLIHWERYGNRGKGVCIAINLWMIDNYFLNYPLPNICTSWIYYDDIIYGKELQKQSIEGYICNRLKDFEGKNVPNLCELIYYVALSFIKPLFKHEGYIDEHEYRLILKEGELESMASYYHEIAKKDNDELFFNISKHMIEAASNLKLQKCDKEYGIFNGGIRSYYAMSLHKLWGDALIPEIIIGPKCYQNKAELKSFLVQNELSGTKLSVSNIPIR